MNDDIVDLLKIKIEKAKSLLPEATQNAIAAIDWRAAILLLRDKYGYSFEQLGDLEIETELVLCGLVTPEDYPKEIARRLEISKAATNDLINEMNELVFKKIKEELIKNTERKKIFRETLEKKDINILNKNGIEIMPDRLNVSNTPIKNEKEEDQKTENHPLLINKLSSSVQIPTIKTDHTLDNLTKTNTANLSNIEIPKGSVDPYREIPE